MQGIDAIAQSGSAQSGSIQTGTSPFAVTAQSNSSQYEPLEPYDTMTGTAIAISDADEAEALSEYLTSPDRQHPAVVVTRRFGKPLFDAKSLASNLHDVAAVFDLVTPKATWGLSAALPESTRVYNGSARVYPPGIDWVDNPSALPYYVGWSTMRNTSATGCCPSPTRMGHAVRSGREEKPCAAEDMGVFRLVLRHAGIHTHQRQQGGGRDGRGADRARHRARGARRITVR